MSKQSLRSWALIFACLGLIALVGCQAQVRNDGPEAPSDRNQLEDEEKFELVGLVTDVEIEELDVDTSTSPSPAEDEVRVEVHLTVEVQTINDPARDLCGIERGDEVVLVVTDDTRIDPKKAVNELDEFDDQKISAGGRVTLESDRGTDAGSEAMATATMTADAPDNCLFVVEHLRVVQGDDENRTSPGTAGSPSPTSVSSPTPSYTP